jgi:phenylalanyl-tRNA synthetase beta chain
MKIQLDWLKEYVDADLSAEELGHLLTMAGLEIESHETVELSDGEKTQVLELNVTPNRGYCLSYFGVAREVSALIGKSFMPPDYEAELEKVWGVDSVGEELKVDNREPELCLRYSGMVIENITPGPSPKWLVDRLTAIGLRSVNNIVDVTNFVLMEYGQPLHAFDKDSLDGSSILVRRSAEGEEFTSIDGSNLKLDQDALVIADANKVVALAGIMGGANSQVTESTRHIILESASFDSVVVRKGSKKYGLRSDSSIRFERGVDIESVISAQARAALLIRQLAGGTIRKGRIDVYPIPQAIRELPLRVSRLNKVLGCALSSDQIEECLSRLSLKVSSLKDNEIFKVEIPSFRPFLTREVDLIEEVARLNGFDEIAVTSPLAAISPVRFTPKQSAVRRVKSLLSGIGFSEIITYSFIDSVDAKIFQSALSTSIETDLIPLDNPISNDLGVMRPSLLPGLVKSAIRNFSKGKKDVRIFEFGHVFMSGKTGKREEILIFSALVAGVHGNNLWEQTGKHHDYFDLKGTLDSVCRCLKLKLTEHAEMKRPFMLKGKSVGLKVDGQDCGYLGELSPGIVRQYELPKRCIVFELNFDRCVNALPKQVQFSPIAKFPEVYRDISVLIDKVIVSDEVINRINQAGGSLLRRIELYDHFEGNKIQEGKKSLTYALTFQSNDRTLSDEEINPIFEKIVKTLSTELGAMLRE